MAGMLCGTKDGGIIVTNKANDQGSSRDSLGLDLWRKSVTEASEPQNIEQGIPKYEVRESGVQNHHWSTNK